MRRPLDATQQHIFGEALTQHPLAGKLQAEPIEGGMRSMIATMAYQDRVRHAEAPTGRTPSQPPALEVLGCVRCAAVRDRQPRWPADLRSAGILV